MSPPRTILAIVNAEWEYARGVLYGLYEYANASAQWRVEHVSLRELRPGLVLPEAVDGVVLQSMNVATAQWALAQTVPVVNVGEPPDDLPFPCVIPDHEAIGQAAAEHLVERGFHRLGFFGSAWRNYGQQRLRGFSRTAEAVGLMVEVFPGREDRDEGDYGAIRCWLKALGAPAGVLCADDPTASNLLRRAQTLGLKVPEELAVVGVDNTRLNCETVRPKLSSVIVPCERIGYEAAALLAKLIEGAAAPRAPILLKPLGVFVRESSDTFASDDPVVAKTIRLMQQKTNPSFMVADLLRELKVSRRKLEYHFQSALGRTPGQIMRLMQTARAKQMLRTSGLPLTTIAVHCGFTSVRHFARSFHQQVGLTPSQYRGQSFGLRATE